MAIITKKKRGFYILNILNNNSDVNLDDNLLIEIHNIISKIKNTKARIALDLSNVGSITSINFLNFINSNNLNILSLSPHLLAWLSLASTGFLPPVFLSEDDFISKKRQLVKRNFRII
ncbi:MAG: hypothetical protein OSJ27_03625 [Candidatus Gastranaerophilales bacterium]|nr:hypothetical protein [Candidatus Gastranaerophilales bacterium]